MQIRFVLISEGSTEHGLVPHLTQLCIAVGADEVSGVVPAFERLRVPVRHDLVLRLQAVRQLEPTANLCFVHRDADGDDAAPRHHEIEQAVKQSATPQMHIALVPIHETEAWLLLNEDSIRRVAGRPKGHAALDLPLPHQVEQTRHPKERLEEALLAAAQPLRGRRLERFRRDFSQQRQQLLDELGVDGPLEQLSAWRRLRDDTAAAIATLRAAQQ